MKIFGSVVLRLVLLSLLSLVICDHLALAQVYKWTDAKGGVHYTSEPPNPDAKPANLPRITREKINARLSLNIPKSCGNHGGVNCQAGADEDGSVVCFDGFKDSDQRHQFHCQTASLEVSEIKREKEGGRLKAWVRNNKDIPAHNVQVELKLKGKESQIGDGPTTIDSFEIGEYLFDIDEKASEPEQSNFTVACSNCFAAE